MKAICIDGRPVNEYCKPLIEGKVYEVESCGLDDHYWVPEIHQGRKKYRFIPISEVDETELITEIMEECIR